jgi:hypothetical protein
MSGAVVIGVFLLLIPAFPAHADWPMTGVPIARDQTSFSMSSDGNGGIFVGWSLYATHLTRNGDLAQGWPASGIRYGGNSYHLMDIAPDGTGGNFMVFGAKDCEAHCGADPAERRVLRFMADGRLHEGWPEHGIPVGGDRGTIATGAGDYGRTLVLPDGSGGIHVAFGRQIYSRRSDPTELRIQRMDGMGTHLWGDSGHLVRTATHVLPNFALAPDGGQGAFLFWTDQRFPHFFGQRVDGDGVPRWGANGLAMSGIPITFDLRPVAIEDGTRGAYVAWFGTAGSVAGIFMTRVTSSGERPWGTPLRIRAAPVGVEDLRLVPTTNGDAILVWSEVPEPGRVAIRAQRVGRQGRIEWEAEGIQVCSAPGLRHQVAAASDARNGVYIAWADQRPEGEIFGTHLGVRGLPLAGWDVDGTPICPQIADVFTVRMVGDGHGNAMVAWTDGRIPTGGFPRRVTVAMNLLPNGPAWREVGRHPGQPERHARSLEMRADLALVAPAPGEARFRISLPSDGPVSLELFDVAGRRLRSLHLGPLAAGSHGIELPDYRALLPGVYHVRLKQDGRTATGRFFRTR